MIYDYFTAGDGEPEATAEVARSQTHDISYFLAAWLNVWWQSSQVGISVGPRFHPELTRYVQIHEGVNVPVTRFHWLDRTVLQIKVLDLEGDERWARMTCTELSAVLRSKFRGAVTVATDSESTDAALNVNRVEVFGPQFMLDESVKPSVPCGVLTVTIWRHPVVGPSNSE